MFSIISQYVFYRFAVPAFYGLKALNICKYAIDKKWKILPIIEDIKYRFAIFEVD